MIVCDWPIQYLQEKLLHIYTGDLFIIGAATGIGKSTLSRLITLEAHKNNNPVVLYSLENAPGTFAMNEARMLYNEETGSNLEDRGFKELENKDPNYFKKYRKLVYEKSKLTTPDGLKLLLLHEDVKAQNMSVEELLASIQKEYDQGYRLFLIDHVDMLITDPKNEINQTVSNMNKLWAYVANHDVAFIVFSQLKDLPPNVLVPNENHLRGSLTKGQRATGVITIAPHEYGLYKIIAHPYAHPTYVKIAKSRDGRSTTGCAVCFFENGHYLPTKCEVSCNKTGTLVDGKTFEWLVKNKAKIEEEQRKNNETYQDTITRIIAKD